MQRLLAIHDRAGAAAKARDDLQAAADVAGPPVADMLEAALGRGAWRTIRGHVLSWERFEKWAGSEGVFPTFEAFLVALAACLHKDGCGLSVVPAFRATAARVSRRLAMPVLDTSAEPLLAIEAAIVEESGQELEEAIAIHVELPWALEILVERWIDDGVIVRGVREWQLLCTVWGSMRFDDALHVRPDRVKDSPHALL